MSEMTILPRVRVIAVAVFALWATRLSAQVTIVESQDNDQPTVYKMTVSPAAEPRPALKYRFLAPAVDQIHENAATFYYKAMGFEGTDAIERMNKVVEDEEQEQALINGPLNRFPEKQAGDLSGWLYWVGTYFEWLQQAARCDHCDWQDNIREWGNAVLLPHVQKSRGLARALVVYARLQIVQGRLDRAIEAFRIGYALSRNLCHGTTVIHTLIGIATQGVLDYQIPNLIAQPDAPNLYWALTDLAIHPVDFREALSYESHWWDFTIHELADLDRRTFTATEALETFGKVLKVAGEKTDIPPSAADQAEILAIAFGTYPEARVSTYPQAREYLLDQGYKAAQIDAMPVLQTILLAWWKQFEVNRDDAFKQMLLPDDEVRAWIDRVDSGVRAAALKGEGGVFTAIELPTTYLVIKAQIRSRRHVELLRIVEALRMYAAEHGHWPEKLDDITTVPIPRDPWSQKPFEYEVQNGVAMLQAPAEPKTGWGGADSRYELTLRAGSKSQ